MVQKVSRITAIYDVHGNLPALQTVLAELESVNPDLIVVGGDVVAGPMPAEVLDRLAALSESVCFVRGNADREVVAAYDDRPHADPIDVADPAERVAAYAASRIDREHRDLLASFAERLIVEVEGVGQVLFCHGSPRSDEEIVTAATTEGRLREILAEVDQDLVVCGHTHAQFDRCVSAKRVVNAGSVGMPYQGKPVGAFWLLLGAGGVCLRRSDYDLDRALSAGLGEERENREGLARPRHPLSSLLKNPRFLCRSRPRFPQLLKAAVNVVVADEQFLDDPRA
jgi:putative phosphoesterase